ncbi:fimbrial biogenesis chaperone [Sphingomonas kyeonggiensis]|uniref:Fimbrial chaperone protein n=1 Tax=Sphingomonas kyeonggiensis TaxID=1268553 RepID=A0A7W6JSC0_9SPHN|nr:fimbria/pilus periplasmic chaperone [Sphingomonas kyeonggiensis]MBB4098699.1 fimbrial chaperone protein [Sphingomonas kyeonggiensis]
MKKWIHGLALGTALAAAMLASSPLVKAETVQPVVIDLSPTGSGMSQTITVENTFTQPLPVELRVEELTFDQTGLHGTGKDSGDLLIFPPQAIIQPGQTQSFRVQYIGDPALARSKHYYVTVAQLPVQLPQGQSAIQILYNFQVLVSVKPAGAKAQLKIAQSEVARDEKGQPVAAITLTNDSPAHGYLSKGRLRIVERDRSGKEVFRRTLAGPEIQQTVGFGLVGAGQTRRLLIPVQLPTSEGTIDAQFTPEG